MPPKKSSPPRYHLRNWPEYNAALTQRGRLTLWLDDAALTAWGSTARSGQRGRPRVYSDLALTCLLTLQTIYHLPLRQTVGFARSLFALLGLELPVAHPATLSRRRRGLEVRLPVTGRRAGVHLVCDATGLKVYGEGEWKVRRHGWTKHRTWLKVHLGVDEATSEVRVAGVSTNDVSDGAMLPDLLATETAPLTQVTGDGIYDEWRCYEAVAQRPEHPRAVFPPPRPRRGPRRARLRQHGNTKAPPLDRDEHLRAIRRVGRRRWKEDVHYHRRSLAEPAVFRLKTLFGPRVSARTFAGQATEVFLRCAALNRMAELGMPASYRVAA